MNPSRLTVVARDFDAIRIARDLEEWDALTLVAAVSSDPRSFCELGLSWLRYRPDQPLEALDWECVEGATFIEVHSNAPGETPEWLLVDLACMKLETNVDDLVHGERAAFQRDEGNWTPDNPVIWINLPPSWTVICSQGGQPNLQPLPAPVEPIDFRGVLYGRAMTDHVAARMSKLADGGELPEEVIRPDDLPWEIDRDDPRVAIAERWHELTLQVHADWLMTERSDLDNQCPRLFLHRHRQWAEWEEEGRRRQWSNLNCPPRPLDRNTHTYRYGPMNRDEVVIYFDLCREVIPVGWRALFERPELRSDPKELSNILYEHVQHWLKSGSIEDDPVPPAAMIEASRRHMPRLASGVHLDCECPLCRMMVDDLDDDGATSYPTFSGFDGHHLELDGQFAFSLCETREEFEQAEADYRELSEKVEREQAQREFSAASAETLGDEGAEEDRPVWTGYVNPELDGVDIMTLGFRLAELVGDLQSLRSASADLRPRADSTQSALSRQPILAVDKTATTELIQRLNEQFDILRTTPPISIDRRIVIEPMIDALERLHDQFPELQTKSADLQSQLYEWSRQPATRP